MRGYKVFEADWTCRGYQYEVGEVFEIDAEPVLCERGFHFCERLLDCWVYMHWTGEEKIAEVEALGPVVRDFDKCVTNKIKIVREISAEEMLAACNIGRENSGVKNTGDGNTGFRNSGNYNSGHENSGGGNSGNWNAGHLNSGHENAGNKNIGNGNSGCGNSGDQNSGDWNFGCGCSGCFCEKSGTISFFDEPSSWTLDDWLHCGQRIIMSGAPSPVKTTDTGGYEKMSADELKSKRQEWWDCISREEKKLISELPNFDAEKFARIMGGIDLGGDFNV